jgi:hypothetical protein
MVAHGDASLPDHLEVSSGSLLEGGSLCFVLQFVVL